MSCAAEGGEQGLRGYEAALAAHEGFVRREAARWAAQVPWVDVQDLEQEGRLALCWAVDRFDAGRGVKFISYAGDVVRFKMRHYTQKVGAVVRLPRDQYCLDPVKVWLDAPMDEEAERTMHGALAAPVPEVWEMEDRHLRVRQVLRAMSSGLDARRRHALIECVGKGRPGRAVAAEMGMSHTRVQQYVREGLERVRRAVRRLNGRDAKDGRDVQTKETQL